MMGRLVLDQNGFSAFGPNGAIWIMLRDWRPMWTDFKKNVDRLGKEMWTDLENIF